MANIEQFEMLAERYDTPERIMVAKKVANAIRDILPSTKINQGIDFGCGTGLVGLELLDKFTNLLFLDSSEKMIFQVEKKLESRANKNAATLCFDLESGILPQVKADCIFMSQVLLHIPSTENFLMQIRKLLKPNGLLIIIDFDKNEKVDATFVHNGFNQGELKEVLIRIGYKEVRSAIFYEGLKLFMGENASLFILTAEKNNG